MPWQVLIGCLAAIFFGSHAAAQNSSDDATADRAAALARTGHYRDAIGALDSLIARNPDNNGYRLRRAQYLSWSGRLHSSREEYEALVRKNPNDLDAKTGAGLTQFWTGDFAAAQQTFQSILNAQPDNSLAFYSYLRVLIASGKPSKAFEIAREADEKGGGKDAELGLILASLAMRSGDAALFDRTTSRATDDTDLVRRRNALKAQRAVSLGRSGEAILLVKDFAGAHPQDVDAMVDAANTLAQADQRAEARAFYEKAAAAMPEKLDPRLGLARMASREGRLAGSLALYEEIVRANPEALEGWLGVFRTAQLMDDLSRTSEAIAAAEKLAAQSATVQEEKLRMLLQAGRAGEFQRALDAWHNTSPESSFLWEQSWAAANGRPIDAAQLLARLDPLATESIGQIVHLLFRADSNFDPNELTRRFSSASPRARYAVAHHLALWLDADSAGKLVSENPPTDQLQIDAFASGWWAYAATPFAFAEELKRDFDSQAITVWLAAQWQRRVRTMAVEAESPLQDEWWMERALWFETWRDQWSSTAAADDLRARVEKAVRNRRIALRDISDAWRRSESSPVDSSSFASEMTVARWRQYRFYYAGALQILDRLARDFPSAVEVPQRKAAILRASGCWEESARVYTELSRSEMASPQIRLDLADLLRRLGRPVAAAEQLRVLREQNFNEAELDRADADWNAAQELPDRAVASVENGLARHATSTSLLEAKAEFLRKSGHDAELAELIEKNPQAPWITPDFVGPALPSLSEKTLGEITRSPAWWFNWQWLPFIRTSERSLRSIEDQSARALAEHDARASLAILNKPMSAGIPDSDLWFSAARLFDFNGSIPESERAFRISLQLGLGRLDAETGELVENARHMNPSAAAREFAARLEDRPYEQTLRAGLISALLRAGNVAAADRALQPLIESAPDDPAVRLLDAQVKASAGRVRQARSLYQSILRLDPLSFDARAGRRALNDADEIGVTTGYEHSFLHDTTGAGTKRADWDDTFLAGFWRWPYQQTYSFEYHHLSRFGQSADQLYLAWAKRLTDRWQVRLGQATALSGNFIPQWRAGGGASYRLTEQTYADLDVNYLDFRDVSVFQAVPGITWRWHPRFAASMKVYASDSEFRGGKSNQTFTYSIGNSWEFSPQSWVQVRYSVGGEDNSNLTRNLIGENGFQSVGIKFRLGWRHRFAIEPSYTFEQHRRFDLHSIGMALNYAY